MDPREATVECPRHGTNYATFVCRHIAESLRTGTPVGFLTAAADDGNSRPDAWCAMCEEAVWRTGGEWTDESESLARVTMICSACYDQAKALNDRGNRA
jgi:hypothetical protein